MSSSLVAQFPEVFGTISSSISSTCTWSPFPLLPLRTAFGGSTYSSSDTFPQETVQATPQGSCSLVPNLPPNAADDPAYADDDPNANFLYNANNCPNAATGAGVVGFFASDSDGAGCKGTPCCYYGSLGNTNQCSDSPKNTGNLNFNAQGSSTQLLVNQSPNTVSNYLSQLSYSRKPVANSNIMFCHLKSEFPTPTGWGMGA